MTRRTPRAEPTPHLADVVERNIRALLRRREREEKAKGIQERVADAITRFAGSMRFVYLHLVVVGLWVVVNLGILPVAAFDPTFTILASAASVEAIFLSTFVLISQNRMAAVADKRADLDVQISLLTEHEVTRLVELVQSMAERLGIPAAANPELAELKQDVAPERVLDSIEHEEWEFESESGDPPPPDP